ncbi:hypothetical protein NDU88_006900 [Pleurodeles waltl]|uniref:Uncharacterized protein n=1 Tax=Pleurodeles waltl TaxID=8319 RepID=A0AAV7SR64_PLEWA|nr:hypothetical protein NDU88_006900 [Pleurodeles waltl]
MAGARRCSSQKLRADQCASRCSRPRGPATIGAGEAEALQLQCDTGAVAALNCLHYMSLIEQRSGVRGRDGTARVQGCCLWHLRVDRSASRCLWFCGPAAKGAVRTVLHQLLSATDNFDQHAATMTGGPSKLWYWRGELRLLMTQLKSRRRHIEGEAHGF